MTPILFPIAEQYGVSLVHLGRSDGQRHLHRPYHAAYGSEPVYGRTGGRTAIHKVIGAIKPFIIVTLIGFLLVAFIPQITTFLPSLLQK